MEKLEDIKYLLKRILEKDEKYIEYREDIKNKIMIYYVEYNKERKEIKRMIEYYNLSYKNVDKSIRKKNKKILKEKMDKNNRIKREIIPLIDKVFL